MDAIVGSVRSSWLPTRDGCCIDGGKINKKMENGRSSISFAQSYSYSPKNQRLSAGGWKSYQCQAFADNGISNVALAKHAWDLISDAENLSFIERLVKAWHILFPQKHRSKSNADIAKQRLKMILIADRCSVSDEAKRKIVTNIIDALSDFVEIESEEKVQLNVTTDPLLGTIYAVTIPVRRVKPEYQNHNKEVKEVHSDEAFREFKIRFD